MRSLSLALLAFLPAVLAGVSNGATSGGHIGNTYLGSRFGNCCSQYGWCGYQTAYCNAGCQSAFGTCSGAVSSPPLSSTPTSSPASSSTQVVSTNARCGPSFGGKTCLGSKYGDCCSQYSYCGSTIAYCAADTCQKGYGKCNSALSSSSSSSVISPSSSSSMSPSSSSSSSSIASSTTSASLLVPTSSTSSTPTSSTSSTPAVSSSSSTPVVSSTSSSVTSSSSSALSSASSTVSSTSSSASPSATPCTSSNFYIGVYRISINAFLGQVQLQSTSQNFYNPGSTFVAAGSGTATLFTFNVTGSLVTKADTTLRAAADNGAVGAFYFATPAQLVERTVNYPNAYTVCSRVPTATTDQIVCHQVAGTVTRLVKCGGYFYLAATNPTSGCYEVDLFVQGEVCTS